MTNTAKKPLTAKQAAALKPAATTQRYFIAPNLYLQVSETGSKSFIFTSSLRGKPIKTGLGSWDEKGTLITTKARVFRTWAEAVARAIELKEACASGIDPREDEALWREAHLKPDVKTAIEEAKAEDEGPLSADDPGRDNRRTVRAAFREFMNANPNAWTLDPDLTDVQVKKEGGHHSRTGRMWLENFTLDVIPLIGHKLVHSITFRDVLECIEPKWKTTHTIAWRTRQRLENFIDWCIAMEYRKSANPALYSGKLQKLLTPHASFMKKQGNVPSLPFEQVPAYFALLNERGGASSLCLRWLILTGVRTEAVIGDEVKKTKGADWSEIDWKARTWTVPVERVKGGMMKHIVPLSDAALAFLRSLPACEDGERQPKKGAMFPHSGIGRGRKKASEPITESSMYNLMQRIAKAHPNFGDACPHGFRASFNAWADKNSIEFHVAQGVLGHAIGTSTTRRYSRREHHQDYLDQRGPVMQAWGEYVSGNASAVRGAPSNVIELADRAA